MSVQVPKGGLAPSKDTNRACLSKVEYDRGRKIDMANLVARDSRDKEAGRKIGPVTIAFESVKGGFWCLEKLSFRTGTRVIANYMCSIDREDFAAALEGRAAPPTNQRNAIDELMLMDTSTI